MTRTEPFSLKTWLSYFRAHSQMPDRLPWAEAENLTAAERRCITKSMAAFQLGESSEGGSLLRAAQDYARQTGDDSIVTLTRYFIAEEQQHAELLKRLMQRHDLPLLKRNWTDTVFRRLRRNVGLELAVTVLLTAELISLVYYEALKNCTGSDLLQQLCARLLADEAAHVNYEADLLCLMQTSQSGLTIRVRLLLHRILYAGTVVVVYAEHRRVLCCGGFGLVPFWRACWREFNRFFPPAAVGQFALQQKRIVESEP